LSGNSGRKPNPLLRRVRSDWLTLGAGVLFLLLLIACLGAPLYARYAGTGPNDNHVEDQVPLHGRLTDVVSSDGLPIGATWSRRFLLGADANGRDVAVRLLYGGRSSLAVGASAAGIAVILGTLIGMIAGFAGGITDAILSRAMDMIWAFPAILLGIALGTAMELGGISLGPIRLHNSSLMIAACIIGIVYIPYVGKIVRTQVERLRERDFVHAARLQNAGAIQILWLEILPNILPLIAILIPLVLAQSILLEAGLSYLGAGVRPPNPSWGGMISDGIRLLPGVIHLTLAPGVMLVATTLSINVCGDGLRKALDPRGQLGGTVR
jgi:peptide/nickel transport system permease protein